MNISSASGYLNQPPKFKTHLGRTGFAVMATKEKSTGRLPKIKNDTFDMSSIASSAVNEKLFGRADKEAEEDDDGPVVFICKKCRLPVGDSMSWDGSEEDQKQIKLKREYDLFLCASFPHYVYPLVCGSVYQPTIHSSHPFIHSSINPSIIFFLTVFVGSRIKACPLRIYLS